MHLLITGGAGFLGSHFVRSVLRDSIDGLAGARVTVLDKLTYAGNFANLGPVAESKRLDFVPGDVADRSVIDAVVRGADAILHLAAESDDGFAVTNVMGTQVLLDAALRHAPPGSCRSPPTRCTGRSRRARGPSGRRCRRTRRTRRARPARICWRCRTTGPTACRWW